MYAYTHMSMHIFMVFLFRSFVSFATTFLDHLVKKTLNILRATFDNLALNTAHGKSYSTIWSIHFFDNFHGKNNNARIKSLNHNKDFLLTYDNNFRGMRLFDI